MSNDAPTLRAPSQPAEGLPSMETAPNEGPFLSATRVMPDPLPCNVGREAAEFAYAACVIRRIDQMEDHIGDWEDLAAAALEPNVFFEPFFLLPALKNLNVGQNLEFLVITESDRSGRAPIRWTALFPFVRTNRLYRLPVNTLKFVHHDYCFLKTPLVRAKRADQTLRCAVQWMREESDASVVQLADQTGDGPYHVALAEVLHEANIGVETPAPQARAILRRSADAETFIRSHISAGKIKELRRLERRLSECGKLQFESLALTGDVRQAIDEFLAVELSGWKGKAGSAIACRDSDRAFFTQMATAAHQRGRLRIQFLRLDGRPIAAKCNLLSPPGSFAFKIAFDESFARYSPGLLMEIDNIRRFHEEPGLEWMDSCADPVHPMINGMWRDRRAIQNWTISVGGRWGGLIAASRPILKWLTRRA